ncbi:MAG TPA: MarC family protein [Rectinemataceae bacterium]|nr:MarC family protein [Rectinemataceae bacterium]
MVELFLQILVTIFIVMDPLGAVPIFISVAGGLEAERKRRTIRSALVIAFVVLAVFILGGRYILRFMGIKPGSFYVAGGVLFFLIAIDMLFGQPKRAKTSSEEEPEEDGPSSIAVFPLAIPLIAGPGMITTIMLYSAGEYEPVSTTLMLFGSVLIGLAAMFAALSMSGLILRALGKTGVSVIERMMGLLLSGLAIQFVYDGLTKLGVLGHP